MERITVIGHFAFGQDLVNGQTIKAKTVTDELRRQVGADHVIQIDTYGGIKTYIKLPVLILIALIKSKDVVIFPAQNGVQILCPLLIIMNCLLHRQLHYVVIGGWLSDFLTTHRILKFFLKKFKKIYVETESLKEKLKRQDVINVVIMPNFKKLKRIHPDNICVDTERPHKLCTFSRVMEEKGIEDAISTIMEINTEIPGMATLDIYGPIEPKYQKRFTEVLNNCDESIRYCGIIEFDKSTEILSQYCALLFPTKFYTEGVPGTLIDAFAAGIPVIASRWESFSDVIINDSVGYGYKFGHREELKKAVCKIIEKAEVQVETLKEMKINCINEAKKYTPELGIRILMENLRDSKTSD